MIEIRYCPDNRCTEMYPVLKCYDAFHHRLQYYCKILYCNYVLILIRCVVILTDLLDFYTYIQKYFFKY